MNISCRWKCRNLNYGTECKTITGDLIDVSNITELEIHIPKKRLQPYNVFSFTLSC